MSYKDILWNRFTSTTYSHMIAIDDHAYKLRDRVYRKRFNKVLPTDMGATILDVGCGLGFFLHFLKCAGYSNAFGIDIGPEQIEIARGHGLKNVELCGWREHLFERKNAYDFILADNVCEHFSKDEMVEFLQMARSSLKKNGRIYISVPNCASPFGLPLACIDFTHEIFFSADSLRQVLEACHFGNIRIFGEALKAYSVLSAIRKMLFMILSIVLKPFFLIGTGGIGSMANIHHVLEPSIAAIASRE